MLHVMNAFGGIKENSVSPYLRVSKNITMLVLNPISNY